MPTYTVTEILGRREWGEGDKKVNYFDFKVAGEERRCNVGRKPGNDLVVGETLDGVLEADERGTLKFKKTNNFGGGAGPRPDNPATRRSIQMQASQKVAVDVARLALEGREGAPATRQQITEAVKHIANELFEQIEGVAK